MRTLLAIPVLLGAALFTFMGAGPAAAQEHRAGQSYSSGRSSSGRSYSSQGARSYQNTGRGYQSAGRQYTQGRSDYRGGNYGGNYGYSRGRDYDRYRGGLGGFSLGFYSTPNYYYAPAYDYSYGPGYSSYAQPVCNPNGFYDRYGYWHPDPNCAVDPYGY
jgi:hypothetical protein